MQKVSFGFLFVIRLRDASGMPSGFLRLHNLFFFLVSQQMQPGKPLPGIRSLMAVINSVGVGRGSKSVGEFTYRYTRGRTIASRRITKNTSKTPAQVGRRGAFGSFVWMFSPYKWFFSDGYEKTKHGSSFNQFVHVNRELLGKSPYNSEVNKKLIPNGKQLFNLLRTITNSAVPHLKYLSFGSLPSTNAFSASSDSWFYGTGTVILYLDDFKGLELIINTVTNTGETYTNSINPYVNSEYPNFSEEFSWMSGDNSISFTTDIEQGTVSVRLTSAALLAHALGLTDYPSSRIESYHTVILKQYGKIANIERVIHTVLNQKPSSSDNE